MTTFLLMAGASMKNNSLALNWVPYIYYLIWFKKSEVQVQALIDSGNELNAMTLRYALKLGLKICLTNVRVQKIDGSTLKTFEMVLASFQMKDTLGRARFFQETFLLADLSVEIVLEMPFLTLSNADIKFTWKKLIWRFYAAAEALLTIKRVKIIN